MIKSQALEVNIASYHVDVEPDPKYNLIQDVMSKYFGLKEGVHTFLKEISHPRRNLQFIVNEARSYSLNYFHLLKDHPKGAKAATLFIDIFIDVLKSAPSADVQTDAVDNLLLFLQKIIRESGNLHISKFMPVLNSTFNTIRNFDDRIFFLFVKSYYRMEKLAEDMISYPADTDMDFKELNLLLLKYYQRTYSYWLSEKDPFTWFENEVEHIDNYEQVFEIFEEISHRQIEILDLSLNQAAYMDQGLSDREKAFLQVKELLNLPGYNNIVEKYREIPRRLFDAGMEKNRGNLWKVVFLFHIMNISGLSLIHEEALRDINRTLAWLITNEKHLNIEKLIEKTFSILKTRAKDFPATALTCILNMGNGVYKTDESDLVKIFINSVTELGFQSPMIGGVGNDWQIRVNSSHIQNIRTWLELIELNPKWSTRLLSDLIINISLSGVFIKDTDLFPRDITRLLNSDIRPVYNLVKQLARLFPVYFNDIGAEGALRDISTQIDEITNRKDILIHFLRKQTHVESSNRVIGFIEAVILFWLSKDKKHVDHFVPPSIYEQIKENGDYIDGVHNVLVHLKENKDLSLPEHLLALSDTDLAGLIEDVADLSPNDVQRVELAARLYKLLHQKYNLVMGLDFCSEIESYLNHLKIEAFPDLNKLRQALEEPDIHKKLPMLLEYLELLKKLILSKTTYDIREDIYKKRHFTVDIPSMYGSYHEMKFDALGLTFRIESLVNICFEEIVENIDLSIITRETFYQIYELLKLFDRALKLDGISSVEIESQLELLVHALRARGFTFTQYLDIFKGFARAVSNIINDYFNNIHENNLTRILSQIPVERILDKYIPPDICKDDKDCVDKIKHRIPEIFFRDKIALSLGLQQLDLFLSRILKTLFHQSYKLPDDKLRLLLNYDPQRAMMSITEPDNRAIGIIHLGNKGYNLVKLNKLKFPIPPGFIITTEVFRSREIVEQYPQAAQNFKKQISNHIKKLEKMTGKLFGNPGNPLLFSVRSGSSISQPGMMDTFLDVGINEDIAAGIAHKTGNLWFAWDNYRRFIQCYGMAFDLHRDEFDAIMRSFKEKEGISYKRGFTGQQMKSLALAYKKTVQDAGIEIIEDPFEQLLLTIQKVLNSWESDKAKTYRKIMSISDDWGTAVTVQSMVYGNLSKKAGTGVFFTHTPKWSEDNVRLWGDFTMGNQGEDVVAGLVKTLPISIIQQENEMRNTDITLETYFPEIYAALKKWASELIYKRGWSPQEMEFTFESPDQKDLYLLQTRNMAIRERRKFFTFDLENMTQDQVFLGHGIGVSGGAMTGRAVFSLENIDKWREEESGTNLILIRGDTVPDDIREINAADGLLTARGGVTSHASVVAHRLGKTCVVGCGNLVCNEKKQTSYFDNELIRSGDFISIDGQEGLVYKGFMKVKES
ncbi:Pyruvate phosphate dikinase, PEP/pyruvate-binding [Desulfonema limicola]|uniref:Pyruvate phosphate dikinase, PEP/pyruvate-binding n=1 Tax=Desulfonema limicola TaxID=45656 RepID=A0A975BC20_9BACT|nr:PEP/pyruvate-binding domain-containing protein [Desulfonema limicola]QTA82563.1 Pyruvate phosphate dikinase, PEP/pyruvate-binding [Desulfonema limicola]